MSRASFRLNGRVASLNFRVKLVHQTRPLLNPLAPWPLQVVKQGSIVLPAHLVPSTADRGTGAIFCCYDGPAGEPVRYKY